MVWPKFNNVSADKVHGEGATLGVGAGFSVGSYRQAAVAENSGYIMRVRRGKYLNGIECRC